jgi:hypothetical protein
MMANNYNEAAWQMLIALRGGISDNCDFCCKAFGPERSPVPEEAGAWACTECQAWWDKEES